MVATQRIELQQMKQVLDEMNTHPDARLFYAMQEKVRSDPVDGAQWNPKMTIGRITEKVNRQLYSSLSAFVEDMTLIFTDCPFDSGLAAGAPMLRGLFSEILAKHTNSMDEHGATPPGRNKRSRKPRFELYDWEEDFTQEFEDCFMSGSDILCELPGEDQAALLELTEEISAIEAEIQLLKDTKVNLQVQTDSSHPGFPTHKEADTMRTPAYSLGSGSGLFASSVEEGRQALSGQQNKKRSRRSTGNEPNPLVTSSSKRQRVTNELLVSKEQLLYMITHDLPPKFLEGVIRIVNPSFDPNTASDEDLEFDINLLDDEVLLQLQQYVFSSIAPPKKEVSPSQKRKEVPKRKLKKEAPKSRLRNQRKRMTRNNVAPKPKRQATARKQQQYLSSLGAKRGFVSSEVMREIFKSEEIVRVKKAQDEEDEEVDILAD